MRKTLLFVIGLLIVTVSSLYAQLVTVAGGTPASVVTSLVDPILNPSNPTISCPAAQYGTFTSSGLALSKVGANSGVILSTGKVIDAIKNPSTEASTPAFTIAVCGSGTATSDPELTSIIAAGSSKYDACILEVDITPNADSLKVNYVFGSEEYYTYCAPGSSFNDAFGFFVKNLPGGTYQNFATIPGTSLPVSVANIYPTNCATPPKNAAYFNDNTTVNTTGVVYNGLTKPMVGQIPIIRGNSYHLKIAICDVGDACLDAGLFMKTVSFAIPVQLLSFKAVKKSDINRLLWVTTNEKNCDRYEILRSSDGRNFDVIGTIKGAGTSSNVHNYEFTDRFPQQGVNYYRLRQIDFNGRDDHSEIKSITNLIKIAADRLYPNPATEPVVHAQINVPFEGNVTSTISDISGKTVLSSVHEVQEGINTIDLLTEALPKGIYYVKFSSEGFESEVLKFVK